MTSHNHFMARSRGPGAVSLLALVLALVLAVGGCSEDDPASPSIPRFDHASSTTAGGLRLSVSTPQETYAFGESFEIRVELTNVSDQSQTLDFSRGSPARYPNLGLNVDDEDGAAHFVDGDGERDGYPLAPGASLTATFSWDQVSRFTRSPVERGVYQAIGFVNFDDRDQLKVNDLFIQLD